MSAKSDFRAALDPREKRLKLKFGATIPKMRQDVSIEALAHALSAKDRKRAFAAVETASDPAMMKPMLPEIESAFRQGQRMGKGMMNSAIKKAK